ncbi:MAG TPA: amidohydrolase family protein [Vicinamibacterales bacterium]|nr:amidohydrolase family protein [Vicinamibacterales bacterium]
MSYPGGIMPRAGRRLSLLLAGAAALAASAAVVAQDLSIREYKPKSTLVVPAHPVPRAKYPVIDVHSHHSRLTRDDYARVVRDMDALNLRVLVNLSGGSGEEMKGMLAMIAASPAPDRMVVFANPDFSDIDVPGYGRRAAARLEADVAAGARGLKIFKNLGLSLKRATGLRVPVDDPELDPLWDACARLAVPVLIHTGEPAPFFDPVDVTNERWLELQVHPQRRRPAGAFPAFEALMTERNRLFTKHRGTTFIAAHMGFHANDLQRLGRMLDAMPNVYVETGAILAELGRQPRFAREFFTKYQDRVLFGKDSWAPPEYPYFWRTFETADEYFDYYRDYHAFWKLYGLDLPDALLRKLYYGNALRVVPGLNAAAFPAISSE